MRNVLNKINTLLWYLRKPALYNQLFRKLKNEYLCYEREKENSRKEALQWCEKKSIGTGKALNYLIGLKEFTPLGKIYPKILKAAEERQIECNARMGGEYGFIILAL